MSFVTLAEIRRTYESRGGGGIIFGWTFCVKAAKVSSGLRGWALGGGRGGGAKDDKGSEERPMAQCLYYYKIF